MMDGQTAAPNKKKTIGAVVAAQKKKMMMIGVPEVEMMTPGVLVAIVSVLFSSILSIPLIGVIPTEFFLLKISAQSNGGGGRSGGGGGRSGGGGGYGGGGGGGRQRTNWICLQSSCGQSNFGHRQECFKCHEPKGDAVDVPAGKEFDFLILM